ncbi:hypothetical protein GCM10018790_05360 [Kitasatospora xanthocidica]|nr:hypothetical protein GCM10018790_05360 [Kitasatospora xanthocidica]
MLRHGPPLGAGTGGVGRLVGLVVAVGAGVVAPALGEAEVGAGADGEAAVAVALGGGVGVGVTLTAPAVAAPTVVPSESATSVDAARRREVRTVKVPHLG